MSDKLNKLLKASRNSYISDFDSVRHALDKFYQEINYNDLLKYAAKKNTSIDCLNDSLAVKLNINIESLCRCPMVQVITFTNHIFMKAYAAEKRKRNSKYVANYKKYHYDIDYEEAILALWCIALDLKVAAAEDLAVRQYGLISVKALYDYLSSLSEGCFGSRNYQKIKRDLQNKCKFELTEATTIRELVTFLSEEIRTKGLADKNDELSGDNFFNDYAEQNALLLKGILFDSVRMLYPEDTKMTQSKEWIRDTEIETRANKLYARKEK